ncbi:acyl-CoA synthetase (NDP forming) [Neobacillus niacini]|uniref:acetate--CoA ligase family protein n=1 Tax=Neobacillus niacini TaxID=86668 RepID=UPI00278857AF|nr:acetate--CoA ligase family protein [Neobacillus niacini]MDQ1002228.1 acyl-CoA synthetase (NDP forming) [Neobacillus niacini]
MDTLDLKLALKPKGVAVFGASAKIGSIGNKVVNNFKNRNYTGEVYLVNPNYHQIEGYPCFPSLLQVSGNATIDLAIIALPVKAMEHAIQECVIKKVRVVLIVSGGFAEIGPVGLQIQENIAQMCKENNIRIIGPNTLGIYNVKDQIVLGFGSIKELLKGDVGLVTQSGGVGSMLFSMGMEEEIGFSYVYMMGNQIDVTTVDTLELLVDDEDTNVIGAYLEGIPNGELFKQVSEKALEQHKPIIVYKSGITDAGQKAALSHTGSLTGSAEVFELVGKKYGIISVDGIPEFIDAIKTFRSGKRSKGNRVASVVISGAVGIMIADGLSKQEFILPELSETTKEKLRLEIPSYLNINNPVDIATTLYTKPALFKHTIETLIEAEEVDMLLIDFPITYKDKEMLFAPDIVEVANKTTKPIFVISHGPQKLVFEFKNFLSKNNVPVFNSVNSATKMARNLLDYEETYTRNVNSAILSHESMVNKEDLPFIQPDKNVLTEPEVKKVLKRFEIPSPKSVISRSLEDLLEGTKNLNYPLVAKVVSPEITHKSDVNGIVLPINSEEELINAYHSILKNVSQHKPFASIEGILVEELAKGPFIEKRLWELPGILFLDQLSYVV